MAGEIEAVDCLVRTRGRMYWCDYTVGQGTAARSVPSSDGLGNATAN